MLNETAQATVRDPLEFRVPQLGEEDRRHFKNLAELRAWAGVGNATAPGIVKGLLSGGNLRSKCSVRVVPTANLLVEVMGTMPALPDAETPGATGLSTDSTATFAGASLALKPYISALPIPIGALLGTDIESELPAIFDRVFGSVLDRAILIGGGTGNDALGVFTASSLGVGTGQDVNAGSTGSARISDLVNLCTQLIALGADPATSAAILHPSLFKTMLAETGDGLEAFKAEILTKGTCIGIPLVLSAYAPTATTAGSYMAVVGDFACYGIGLAAEPAFDLISKVGSDQRTAQGYIYMNGKPLIGEAFLRLKAI
jgi:HK97 family phage major capsid protein